MYFDENSWLFTECEEDDEGGFNPLVKLSLSESFTTFTDISNSNLDNNYTLQPILLTQNIESTLFGDYFAVIIVGPDIAELSTSINSTIISSSYWEVIALRTINEDFNTSVNSNLSTTSNYFLSIITNNTTENNTTINSNSSGSYFLAVPEVFEPAESSSINSSMTGVYA